MNSRYIKNDKKINIFIFIGSSICRPTKVEHGLKYGGISGHPEVVRMSSKRFKGRVPPINKIPDPFRNQKSIQKERS